MELLESLDSTFAISRDLPGKRISAVEPEIGDRDDMRVLAVAEAEIERAGDAALVAMVPALSAQAGALPARKAWHPPARTSPVRRASG